MIQQNLLTQRLKPAPLTTHGFLQHRNGGDACPNCRKKQAGMLQRAAVRSVTTDIAPPIVHEVLRAPGQPLDSATRAFMEPRFGHDFSQVRVHTGARAAESAGAVNALAYTVGRDIVFNNGQYAPGGETGKRLIAHELTHVIQQAATGSKTQAKPLIGSPQDKDEREADRIAGQILYNTRPTPIAVAAATGATIQRVCGTGGIGTPTGCFPDAPVFITGAPSFQFAINCDDFLPGERARMIAVATALPAASGIEVHGYASTDGDATFNENLSCARANKARQVLTDPAPAGAGIPATRLSGVFRHGPTPGPASERRSVVIRSTGTTPAPLAVSFTKVRSASTPAAMPDRLPPRVDTPVSVGVTGGSLPISPITIAVEGAGGGNGSATINGAATTNLTASATINMRGVDQTSPGNAGRLRLSATQGATVLARSDPFSVSSIPQNQSIVRDSLVTGTSRGFVARHTWQSDSGVVGDLDQTDISEQVEIEFRSGSLASNGLTTSGYLGIGTISLLDTHSVPALDSTGSLVLRQVQMFKDLRSGAADITMTNSGYKIGHFILPVPGTGFLGAFADHEVTSMKFGFAVTSLGRSSGAGSGSITEKQAI